MSETQLLVGGVLAALALSAAVFSWWRWLAGPIKVASDDYVHEPATDTPPAVVDALLHGAAGRDAVVATLLDLARRGEIDVHEGIADGQGGFVQDEPGDAVLSRDPKRELPAPLFERSLVVFVFRTAGHGHPHIQVSGLRRWARRHPKGAADWYDGWRVRVVQAAVDAGLLRRSTASWRGAAAALGAAFLVGALFLSTTFAMPPLVVLGVASLAAAARLSRLTRRGAVVRADHERLLNFLRDFGRLDEKPPEAVAIWGRYLALGVVLGEGERALHDLEFVPAVRLAAPEEQHHTGPPTIRPGMLLSDGEIPWDTAGRQLVMEDYLLAGRRTRE